MSNSLLDFHSKDHSGIKYSEMVTSEKYRNGNIEDQNQNSISCDRSDSVTPLTATEIISRGSEAKELDYQDDRLDFKVSKHRARKHRKLFHIFTGIAIMLLIVVIVLAIALGKAVKSSESLCVRPDCVNAAARVLSSMNLSADPCQDFYAYSCGQWTRDHVIPEEKSAVSFFDVVRDRVAIILKRVIESKDVGDRDSVKKAKTYYKSCLDTDTIESIGGQPLFDVIASMGGMPLFGDTLATFNLEESLGHASMKYGSGVLVSMWVSADDKNSSANSIQVDQPRLAMPNRDYYITEERRNATLPAFQTFMTDYLTKLWKERSPATFNESALLEFIERMTNSITSGFDWCKYLNTAFSYVNITLDSSQNIISFGDHYFGNFSKILSKCDDAFLQNYIVWDVLRRRVSLLGKSYRDTEAPYRLAISGTIKERARWRSCVFSTKLNFMMPVGSLYVREAFPEKNKIATESILENVRKSFLDSLPFTDWMDDQTKEEAEKKADMVSPVIAYPDYIVDADDPEMDKSYEGVTVDSKKYFANFQSVSLDSSKVMLAKLNEPVDRDQWINGPATVNAFYVPNFNQISFPAAILQPPFYDPGQSTAMNYGAMGMVVGHELTHGFDDTGSRYNGVGSLEQWWTDESRKNFDEKAKCFEKQYGMYYWKDGKGNINGKLTLGENIADNGGVRRAYSAYEIWKSQDGVDHTLPGLEEFTQDQLFFISNAQIWCGLHRSEYAARLLSTDTHSPGIFRVIGSLSNFEKFGESFNCQRGQDRMYPNEEDVCRVW